MRGGTIRGGATLYRRATVMARLDAAETRRLLARARAGDAAAREAAVVGNLRLTAHIYRRFCEKHGTTPDDPDLFQCATLALVRAVDHYDPAEAPRFSGYLGRALWNALGREWRRRLATRVRERPLDAEPLAPAVEPPSTRAEGRAAVSRLLPTLDPIERAVIRLRFGLAGRRPHTLAQVGARFGRTKEWARQIEARSLDKLKRAVRRAAHNPAPSPRSRRIAS